MVETRVANTSNGTPLDCSTNTLKNHFKLPQKTVYLQQIFKSISKKPSYNYHQYPKMLSNAAA